MTRPPSRHAEAKRACKALQKAGLTVVEVVFPAEGGFRVLTKEAGPAPSSPPGAAKANPWDEVLPGPTLQ